jgi:hypothetical protein
VRVASPPVERHKDEVVAKVITNCPSYKDKPVSRVCVCRDSLKGRLFPVYVFIHLF